MQTFLWEYYWSIRCSAEAGAYATPNQPIQPGKLQATCWHGSAKSGILIGSSRAVNGLTCKRVIVDNKSHSVFLINLQVDSIFRLSNICTMIAILCFEHTQLEMAHSGHIHTGSFANKLVLLTSLRAKFHHPLIQCCSINPLFHLRCQCIPEYRCRWVFLMT